MKHPRWRQFARHPLSGKYADLPAKAFRAMIADMEINGFNKQRPIALYQGKVLDGWQRLRACIEANVPPDFWKVPKSWTDEDAEHYVESMNDLRRHETQDQAMERVEKRQERIAKAREEGESLRVIAEKEKVSMSQVRRDLEAKPPAKEPDKVTGADGKKRRKSASGKAKFSLNDFTDYVSKAMHEIDKMARHYGVGTIKGHAQNREHKELIEAAKRYVKDASEWQKTLANLS